MLASFTFIAVSPFVLRNDRINLLAAPGSWRSIAVVTGIRSLDIAKVHRNLHSLVKN